MLRSSTPRRGQGLGEYGLILALVAVIAIVGVNVFGDQLASTFGNINSGMAVTPGGDEPVGLTPTMGELNINSYQISDDGTTMTIDYNATGNVPFRSLTADNGDGTWYGESSENPSSMNVSCTAVASGAYLLLSGMDGEVAKTYELPDCGGTATLMSGMVAQLALDLSDDGETMTVDVALSVTDGSGTGGDPMIYVVSASMSYFEMAEGASGVFSVPCEVIATDPVRVTGQQGEASAMAWLPACEG